MLPNDDISHQANFGAWLIQSLIIRDCLKDYTDNSGDRCIILIWSPSAHLDSINHTPDRTCTVSQTIVSQYTFWKRAYSSLIEHRHRPDRCRPAGSSHMLDQFPVLQPSKLSPAKLTAVFRLQIIDYSWWYVDFAGVTSKYANSWHKNEQHSCLVSF